MSGWVFARLVKKMAPEDGISRSSFSEAIIHSGLEQLKRGTRNPEMKL